MIATQAIAEERLKSVKSIQSHAEILGYFVRAKLVNCVGMGMKMGLNGDKRGH